MSNSSRFHPRYWPTWIGIGLLWLSVKTLPWKIQRLLGSGIGLLLLPLARKRQKIANTNLKLAFPHLSPKERKELVRKHFQSFGIGIFEVGQGWWGSEDFLARHSSIRGLRHLDQAIQRGKGVILLSAHFTTLEITGHMLGIQRPLHVLYRRNNNPVVEHFLKIGRERHAAGTIHKDDIRSMIRSLKRGGVVWFAFDQNYRRKGSLYSSFFGVRTATNTATSRMAKLTHCAVVPFFGYRTHEGEYQLEILPALENFPGSDEQLDTDRLHHLIEASIMNYPEQYLWVHRRYRNILNSTSPYK